MSAKLSTSFWLITRPSSAYSATGFTRTDFPRNSKENGGRAVALCTGGRSSAPSIASGAIGRLFMYQATASSTRARTSARSTHRRARASAPSAVHGPSPSDGPVAG